MAVLPESLCDHSRPGLRRLTANPLDSTSSGIITGPLARVHAPADGTGRPSHAATSETPSMSAAAAASVIVLPLCTEGMVTPMHRRRFYRPHIVAVRDLPERRHPNARILSRMRKSSFALLVVIAAVVCSSAQPASAQPGAAESLLGIWSGAWDGAGSGGGFELTFEREKEGPITGKVSVTGEPTYKATLKALSFEGKKMSAKYDFTPDESAEVILAASFDGTTASGTWSLREKSTGNEVAAGNWKVTKK